MKKSNKYNYIEGKQITDPDTGTNLQFDIQRENHVEFDYILTRGTTRRNGRLTIAGTSAGVYLDDAYTENASTGVTFFITTDGTLQYTSTNTGNTATFKYREIRFVLILIIHNLIKVISLLKDL